MPGHFFGLECRDQMPKFYWNLHIMLVNMEKIKKMALVMFFFITGKLPVTFES